MRFIDKFLFSALLACLPGGLTARAAEFEVLDKLSVDGYTVLRGSADIPGGGFAVGGSTLVVKDGKVGIGTASPAYQLDVAGDIRIGNANYLNGRTAAGLTTRLLGINTIDAAYIGSVDQAINSLFLLSGPSEVILAYDAPGDILKLKTGNTDRMTIDGGGNIGIGTTAPAASLDVNGGIKVGTVTASCVSAIAGTLRWYEGHVSVCNGSSWRQLDNQPPPTVTGISPLSGVITGGNAITITGTGFNLGLELLIGGAAATVTGISGSQITATTPAGSSGSKEVKITNTDGQYCTGSFTYNPLPTIASVTPVSGFPGTAITITGTGFLAGAGVTVADVSATSIVRVSDTQITAAAPASATNGAKDVRVTNTDTGSIVLTGGFAYRVQATGGAITDVVIGGTNYRVHSFTTIGSTSFVVTRGGEVDVMVVAGGGAGGAAGAGAGGLVYQTGVVVTATTYTAVVGAGGQSWDVVGGATRYDGTDSSINISGVVTALKGQGGVGWDSQPPLTANTWGSGGGGPQSSTGPYPGGKGTPPQGNDGGYDGNNAASYPSAGGGGWGAAGVATTAGSNVSGNGGVGRDMSGIFGTAVGQSGWFAGGGAGSNHQEPHAGASGGMGGGGSIASGAASGGNGLPNTGGGGAGGMNVTGSVSGSGGSGVVIIRYPF